MAGGAARALLDAWTRRGWLAWLLWPVSLLYGMAAMLRRSLYRVHILPAQRVRVPVVVVGNVIAGGAGKTPAVIAIVRHLSARGLHPGVVSRGHGRTTHGCREAKPQSSAADAGDEPVLIARACAVPVFVARRRADAANALLAAYPEVDVLVCDDGLQHYALQRDVEICVFDDRGAGNGFLLPAGPLRESWPRDVDLVLHSGERPAFAGYTARRQLAEHAVRADGARTALSSFVGRPVTAVAGIARPEAFFGMLRAEGLDVAHPIALPDHDSFAGWQPPDAGAHPLLCTEKDAVKLWAAHPEAWAVPLRFTPEPAFLAALDSLLDGRALDASAATLSSPNAPT